MRDLRQLPLGSVDATETTGDDDTVTVLFPGEGYHTFSVDLVEQGDLMRERG